MKTAVKFLLHKLFGFKNYLFVFSLYKIYTLKRDRKEKDFFHFLKIIPENSTVLDIGANIGIMSVHLARKLNNVVVYSFEPMPNNINAFNRIIAFFKLTNVHLLPFALGNNLNETSVEMIMPIISSVRMQGLSHVVHPSILENNIGERVMVKLKSLDNLSELKNLVFPIKAIKIDVENFEFFVLDGGKELLKNNLPIVYAELWDNENRNNCFELFQSLNYKTYIVVDDKLVTFNKGIHHTQNFIFLPASFY